MSAHRKNTLVVDFTTLPKRPVLEQVEEFIKKKLKLDMVDVKSIQMHHLENCVFIELNNASLAPRLHKQHHLRHSFIYEGRDYYVPVYVDGPTTTVKIHDLPPQLPNSTITNTLQQYGKVLTIQNDVWRNYFPGVPNGVRVVRMRIVKPLPVYLTVDNHRSHVTYPTEHQRSNEHQRISTEQQSKPQPPPSTSSEKNQCPPPSADSDSSDDDTDDDDEDIDSHNDDVATNNSKNHVKQCETETTETTDEPTGKRRLSTNTSNSEAKGENDPKRPCDQQSDEIVEKRKNSGWKVYQTRSRKKNGNEPK